MTAPGEDEDVESQFPLDLSEVGMLYGMLRVTLGLLSPDDKKAAYAEAMLQHEGVETSYEETLEAGEQLLQDMRDFIEEHMPPDKVLLMDVNLETKIKQMKGE